MPTITRGGGTKFYVNHDNIIDISITLKNLIDGTLLSLLSTSHLISSSYTVLYFNAIFISDGSVPFVVYAKEITYRHSPGYTANSVSSGRIWTPDSFVSFEIYDPTGKVAYSLNKEGKEIEDDVDIDTELAVYPHKFCNNHTSE